MPGEWICRLWERGHTDYRPFQHFAIDSGFQLSQYALMHECTKAPVQDEEDEREDCGATASWTAIPDFIADQAAEKGSDPGEHQNGENDEINKIEKVEVEPAAGERQEQANAITHAALKQQMADNPHARKRPGREPWQASPRDESGEGHWNTGDRGKAQKRMGVSAMNLHVSQWASE